jgi:hypothetical protein
LRRGFGAELDGVVHERQRIAAASPDLFLFVINL